MTCPQCHAENRDGLRFCEDCGSRLTLACSQCGGELAPGKRFCGSCGALTGAESARRTPAPESYTPKHLAEKILISKAALEGERKQVTVLFADLKGSMELLADRDPEEARKLLDPVLERMMEAVHRYEGTVNQVMGDGIMALFGAPVAHEDHAVRACYAALRMQESLKRYANDTRRSHGVEVQIRIGLNSGEVVVRSVGSDLRVDYTAVGQTTHLAARMEQLAAPGTVRLTAETVRLAEGYVEVRSLGPIPVKGLAGPMEIFELTGVGTARTRLQAAAIRGLTRFVGRDAEVEHLRRVLGQAGAGRGQVVALVGEAGVGKSRLTHEFTHSHRVQDWLILEASSVSYGKATSYLPVIDLLKGYFKIADRDDHREMRAKVLGRVLGLDRALEPLLPPLLALLDVPVEDAAWQNLDPPQRRHRTLDAVKRLLLRESQAQTLLVVFEDLHWIDGETQALLDSLVESLGSARLLLLVNYRPEYEHRWGSKTAYSQLRLDTLPAENAAELLAALLGPDSGLVPLTQMLVKRGNPFFLEETVRTLVETGALAGERGAYRLTRPVEALQVPATVQTILAARIDRLPPEDKRLLQAAAIVGKDVPFALIHAIADLANEMLRQSLARLQTAEFLYEARLFPDLEYTFKHALTHEVTYGSVLQERRRALHARIVEALEQLHENRLGEHVDTLAHHAFRGEQWEKAVTYLRQAGAKAMERSAYLEATARFEQALDALQHLPETPERTEQAIDLHLDAGGAAGDLTKTTDHARQAEALAASRCDERRRARALVLLATPAWLDGDLDRGLELSQRALAIAIGLDDVPLQASANYLLGVIAQTRGSYRQSAEVFSHVAEALQDRRRSEWLGGSRARLAWSLAELGEFAGAILHGEEAVRIARDVDDFTNLIVAYRSLGIIALRRGAAPEAIPPLERAVELCRVAQVQYLFDVTAGPLGYAYALTGRLSEGVTLMEEALADPAATGTTNHPLLLSYLGEAHLLAGRPDDALAVARRALDLAHRQKERGNEAWALRLLGEIAASADPPDLESGEAHYGRALTRAEELEMRPLAAHCHLGLGKLYRQAGDDAKAQEHLTTATRMYREMDMGFWLAQAEVV
ncbi:MAG: adenylate/guanylate cyclase domain-containing protein [Solirubrobacterales bacterium]